MKRILILLLSVITIASTAQTWPTSLKGRWTFDNTSNLLQATVGTDLILHGTHTAIAGPTATDKAVRIDTGSYYHCYHNIAANGSGSPQYVNRYAILIDFRISQIGQWHSFFQTNA